MSVEVPTTAVVTGAGGWLGQNLVRALAPERARVRCLVHDAAEGPLLELAGRSVEIVVGDVRDPAVLDELFEGVGAPTVFHAAGVIHPPGRTRPFFDVNVGGTQLVLDRARRTGSGRFVHVSSNSPFGANERPTDRFTEESPYNPYLAYGRSKLEGERLVQAAFERGDLQTVICRPPWFYGPYQPARQSQFFAAVRKGRFPMVGDGTQQRSMVYTGNLVDGLLCAEAADAAPGNAYWIADAEPYERSRLRVPRLVGDVAAWTDGRLQSLDRYVQPVHVLGELRDTIACDITAARIDLGYEPKVALVEGMRISIRSCLERGDRL